MSSVAVLNVVTNLLMASSLQLLWKMLASIQLIVHLPLFSVAFPPNARYVFSMVIDLANFKIIPVDWIVDNILGIKKAVSSNNSA